MRAVPASVSSLVTRHRLLLGTRYSLLVTRIMADTQHANVPASVPGMCLEAMRRHAKQDALCLKKEGQWLRISGDAFIARVRAVALGLSSLGVRKGDRVALLSENRPDWSVVDLAILSLGAVNVPIYTTQ